MRIGRNVNILVIMSLILIGLLTKSVLADATEQLKPLVEQSPNTVLAWRSGILLLSGGGVSALTWIYFQIKKIVKDIKSGKDAEVARELEHEKKKAHEQHELDQYKVKYDVLETKFADLASKNNAELKLALEIANSSKAALEERIKSLEGMVKELQRQNSEMNTERRDLLRKMDEQKILIEESVAYREENARLAEKLLASENRIKRVLQDCTTTASMLEMAEREKNRLIADNARLLEKIDNLTNQLQKYKPVEDLLSKRVISHVEHKVDEIADQVDKEPPQY